METKQYPDGWHPGSVTETGALALLMMRTQLVYRSPACSSCSNWLSSGMKRLCWINGQLQAAVVVSDTVPVADLLFVCSMPDVNFAVALQELEVELVHRGARWLRIFDSSKWLLRPLLDTYSYVDTIVCYERGGKPLDGFAIPERITHHPIEAGDIDALLDLDARCFIPFWQASQAELTKWLNNAQYSFLLCSVGEVIAYIIAGYRERVGYIHRLAVSPDRQGQGLGRWLMTFTIQQMLAAHVRSIKLNTQASNQRSRRLYESLGFYLIDKSISVYAKEL